MPNLDEEIPEPKVILKNNPSLLVHVLQEFTMVNHQVKTRLS